MSFSEGEQDNLDTSLEQDHHEADETLEKNESKDSIDEELEEMKQKVKEMEEEAEKLKNMQKETEGLTGISSTASKEEIDNRSIYVGNVDYSATPDELQEHFKSCDNINRVTICSDKFTGHPKGFAYVEFSEKEGVNNAVVLNDSLFKGRLIKVTPKRTNVPGMGPRGRRRSGFRQRRPFRRRSNYFHPYAQ